jgi:anti-sigma regulatory factor (Ser/Thr protein kinase)
MEAIIMRENNIINIAGDIYATNSHFLFSNLYQAIVEKGYNQIILNFDACSSIFSSTMVTLCAYAMKYGKEKVDFDLILPKTERLKRLFLNSNWAHLINPVNYRPSEFNGYRQVPTNQYTDPKDLSRILELIINSLLCSYPDLNRNSFAAIEWAVSEIMDNVLVHSNSPIGGLAQLTTYNNKNKKIEILISDAGVGIPQTLKNKISDIDTDIKALMASIREGITSGNGQGNGLFGAFNVCRESRGIFVIDSNTTILTYNERDGLHVKSNKIPIIGTTICAIINCNVENLLERALIFNNKIHYPIDYIENYYEIKKENKFSVFIESVSVGSRISGLPLRNKIKNIANMINDIIYIDFDNINVASSSFLDEFIIKLIEDISLDKFKKKYKIINISDTLLNLLGKSYFQRMKSDINELFE